MILLANPGRRLTRTELVNARYGHREDGGPMTAANLQRTYVSYLRRRLRKHGINVHIDGFVGLGGFAFRGFSLCEPAEQVSVDANQLYARVGKTAGDACWCMGTDEQRRAIEATGVDCTALTKGYVTPHEQRQAISDADCVFARDDTRLYHLTKRVWDNC